MKLKEQKEELESIIERHLSFIDKLIQDKKSLNEQCQSLSEHLKSYEGGNEKVIGKIKQDHQLELKQMK